MEKTRLKSAAITAFLVILLCFALFLAYLCFFEDNDIFQARAFGSAQMILKVTEQDIPDASAPAGIRRQLTWVMPDVKGNETCLVFYLVHHYAEVRFDDALVYSLSPGENDRLTDSPSSNWVIIPIYPSDSGKTVTVTVTPVFKSVVKRDIQFEIGPRYSILMGHLLTDFPQLLLAFLCILIGLVIIAIRFYLGLQGKMSSVDLFYLGIFAILVGIWRVTDTRYSSILFRGSSLALGYITIGALMLSSTPMLLYMRSYFRDSEKLLLITALVNCAFAAVALVCQITGLAEFRQTLVVYHAILVLDLVVLLFATMHHFYSRKVPGDAWKLVVLIAVGVVLDLIYFYQEGNSSGILFTIVALLIFSIYRLGSGVMNASRKAYTDLRTGLFNKNRWDELMKAPYADGSTVGMMMMDLNRLKYVNDTSGHEAGDRLIYHFANILRNIIPPSNTICRWGGDEFSVLVTNASQEKMEGYVQAIADAVAQYNASDELPKIHYALGWVLSTEFPGLTPGALLDKADKRMYLDKQRWYIDNNIER